MKKINFITTLSIESQQSIAQWLTITKKSFMAILVTIVALQSFQSVRLYLIKNKYSLLQKKMMPQITGQQEQHALLEKKEHLATKIAQLKHTKVHGTPSIASVITPHVEQLRCTKNECEIQLQCPVGKEKKCIETLAQNGALTDIQLKHIERQGKDKQKITCTARRISADTQAKS